MFENLKHSAVASLALLSFAALPAAAQEPPTPGALALETARARVAAQPWVTGVDVSPNGGGGQLHWQVTVTEAEPAEDYLLRLVLDDRQLRVTSFGQRRYDLEDVFMSLVEGDNHGR